MEFPRTQLGSPDLSLMLHLLNDLPPSTINLECHCFPLLVFSGVMETRADQPCLGVQNYLEQAAQKLKAVTPIKFFISSRTDSGVHALCNSAHADIQRAEGKLPFTEEVLVRALNYNLKPEPIRPLNISAMQEAAQYLLGTHDFSAYRSASSENIFKSPIKTLAQLDITPASGHMSHHMPCRDLQFWELMFSSRSFLYKQVRRMTGALVAVGQGRLAAHQVKEILETRDPQAFPNNTIAPPDGLFLKHVAYDETDLKTDENITVS
ncbi:tRNA pseudouridine synthase-like 1 isoform X3 [Microcaecilia unicolor]|uniref:tRNA pseudouridine synthase n=1 Tax=Microcaecilia unicolor TaxID=1415580 RepID=A0A6P7ZWB4_9AMPH|nr:tRNA pseudouridine synthase-like 1 isoform X3 [Microcaecilia unicolor]